MAAGATLFLGLGLMSYAAYAANPGDACSPEGVMGVNQDVAMTCTGGVWVLNALQLGNKSATCDSGKAGYLRYSGGQFEGCDGSSWIQLVSSKLKVYKSDGVTEVGTYIGTRGATGTDKCVGINYTDSTGTLYELADADCHLPNCAAGNYVVWESPNCIGTPYGGLSSPDGFVGFCCTGAGACTSDLCQKATSGAVSITAVSRRDCFGACTSQSASTVARYPMIAPYSALCGLTPCLVK